MQTNIETVSEHLGEEEFGFDVDQRVVDRKEENFQFNSLDEVIGSFNIDQKEWSLNFESRDSNNYLRKESENREWLRVIDNNNKSSLTQSVKGTEDEERHSQILEGLYRRGFATVEYKDEFSGKLAKEIYFADSKGQIFFVAFESDREINNDQGFGDWLDLMDDYDETLPEQKKDTLSIDLDSAFSPKNGGPKTATAERFWESLFSNPKQNKDTQPKADFLQLFTFRKPVEAAGEKNDSQDQDKKQAPSLSLNLFQPTLTTQQRELPHTRVEIAKSIGIHPILKKPAPLVVLPTPIIIEKQTTGITPPLLKEQADLLTPVEIINQDILPTITLDLQPSMLLIHENHGIETARQDLEVSDGLQETEHPVIFLEEETLAAEPSSSLYDEQIISRPDANPSPTPAIISLGHAFEGAKPSLEAAFETLAIDEMEKEDTIVEPVMTHEVVTIIEAALSEPQPLVAERASAEPAQTITIIETPKIEKLDVIRLETKANTAVQAPAIVITETVQDINIEKSIAIEPTAFELADDTINQAAIENSQRQPIIIEPTIQLVEDKTLASVKSGTPARELNFERFEKAEQDILETTTAQESTPLPQRQERPALKMATPIESYKQSREHQVVKQVNKSLPIERPSQQPTESKRDVLQKILKLNAQIKLTPQPPRPISLKSKPRVSGPTAANTSIIKTLADLSRARANENHLYPRPSSIKRVKSPQSRFDELVRFSNQQAQVVQQDDVNQTADDNQAITLKAAA